MRAGVKIENLGSFELKTWEFLGMGTSDCYVFHVENKTFCVDGAGACASGQMLTC